MYGVASSQIQCTEYLYTVAPMRQFAKCPNPTDFLIFRFFDFLIFQSFERKSVVTLIRKYRFYEEKKEISTKLNIYILDITYGIIAFSSYSKGCYDDYYSGYYDGRYESMHFPGCSNGYCDGYCDNCLDGRSNGCSNGCPDSYSDGYYNSYYGTYYIY